jgi:hypothetical protein
MKASLVSSGARSGARGFATRKFEPEISRVCDLSTPHNFNMALIKKTIVALAALGGVLFAGGLGVAWYAYCQIGKTPGELMDYAEQRLQGHNKLEWVALPVMGLMRTVLNQPSRRTLLQIPFVVPPLPTLPKTWPEFEHNVAGHITKYAQPGVNRRVLLVGPFEDIRTIAQAAEIAKDGDTVEIQAGEYWGDVALWRQKNLTIRTRGGRVRLYADGKAAESKAIWVIRNGNFDIDNIEFVGAHVYDHNGAGIRFEGGHLRVTNCLFYANDTGLLTTDSADSLIIENSEFAYNGFGDGYSHNLYVGKMRSLSVTGSYFHHANVGHLIKSRAQYNYIYYNRITDESGGRTSYELDLSNGGIAYVVGNIIQQDFASQNSTLIAYGAEGLTWPENRLYLASNTIVNDQAYGGIFLRTAPGTQLLVSINNLLVGKGEFHRGTVHAETINDNHADWDIFANASRYDYRLNAKGQLLTYTPTALPELLPRRSFEPPHQTRQLIHPPKVPGALQVD